MLLCHCVHALVWLVTLTLMPTLAGGRSASGAGAGSGPAFVPRQRTAVLARAGDSVELSCRVLRLADRAMSWVRSSDLQILTHAGVVFTADSRISCVELSPAPPTPQEPGLGEEPFDLMDDLTATGHVTLHMLRIERVRVSDSGRYECQVNTEPKMSMFFNLTVVESALPKVVVNAVRSTVRGVQGGAARLACGARYEPVAAATAAALPPLRITWKHAGRDIDPQSARGGVSLDSERWAGGASSRLTLGGLTTVDAGRYTCSVAGVSATIMLNVAGDHDPDQDYPQLDDVVGEMQRDQAVARVSAAAPMWPTKLCWLALLLSFTAIAST